MNETFGVIFGIILIALITFFMGFMVGHIVGYKQGQIDCINNEIEYELRVNSDSTITWHKKLD